MSVPVLLSFVAPSLAQQSGSSNLVAWIVGGLVGLVVGGVLALNVVRLVIGKTLSGAKAEAERVVSQARAEGEAEAQRARVEGEKAALAQRQSIEQESERKRAAMREDEQRLKKREDLLDRKLETLASKEEALQKSIDGLKAKETRMTEKESKLDDVLRRQQDELLRIADMTREQAKAELLIKIEEDARHDAAKVARKITEDAIAEAKEKSREITLQAIQRYAAEHTSESTVRSVEIPSDDMKGRIIGREGRNIRAIEKATGVDILVDDTPGVISVSCFDKVRQAIAVEALQKLVADGRVHPTRIEEVVEQVKREMQEKIEKYGRDAVMEANLRSIHPKVREAMGRLHFRSSYGQNVLAHSLEVAYLSQIIADQLGLDGALARRCGFLHDIGKAMDHEMEGGHPKIGMDFAKQYGEKEPVLNAIGGHHADIPATSFYTPIVMAADAVSGARPGARRESLERYIQRLEALQDIALGQKGVTEAYAIQAGREVRVMVDAAKVSDDEAWLVAKRIADKVSEEMTFPGEIKVTVLRETRAIEVAR
ncbi:MAG: ribonuclease Y [Phycisphaerales bacterium]